MSDEEDGDLRERLSKAQGRFLLLSEREKARKDYLAAMKASLKKQCDHLPELVIGTETGERICCECWAEEAEAQLAAAVAALQRIRSVVGTSTEAWHIADNALATPPSGGAATGGTDEPTQGD